MFPSSITTDEADSSDIGMIADSINRWFRAVHNVENTFWQTCVIE